MRLQVDSNAASVTLLTDPSIIMASKKYVDEQIKKVPRRNVGDVSTKFEHRYDAAAYGVATLPVQPNLDLFARAGVRATGGVSSNSLAVFVYELMPNGTDFTIPKERGVQGINLAFIGRDFTVEYDKPFDQAYMRPLFNYGRSRALAGDAWVKRPPL